MSSGRSVLSSGPLTYGPGLGATPLASEGSDPNRSGLHPLAVVVAKWPEPGRVKTRLCPPLSPDGAARLAMALLLDLADAVRRCRDLEWGIAYAPEAAREAFARRFPDAALFPQGEGDLGERMDRVVSRGLEAGHRSVLLLGGDLPALPEGLPSQAAGVLLRGADLVLSPSTDGGYSLIGLSRPCPELFARMPWSGPEVLSETLRRAESLGLRTGLLAPVPDCDTPDDLARLIEHRALPRHTAEWVKRYRLGKG